jgi:hypothetical protein
MKQIIAILTLLACFSCVVTPIYEKKEYINTQVILKDSVTGQIINDISRIDISNYSDMIPRWEFDNPNIIRFEKNRIVHIIFYVRSIKSSGQMTDDYNPKDIYFSGDSEKIEIELIKIP